MCISRLHIQQTFASLYNLVPAYSKGLNMGTAAGMLRPRRVHASSMDVNSWLARGSCNVVADHGQVLSNKKKSKCTQRMFLMYKTSNCGACIAWNRRRTQHTCLQIRLRTNDASNQPKICTHSEVMPVYEQSTFGKWMVNGWTNRLLARFTTSNKADLPQKNSCWNVF